jgi:hypothetical protein
MIHQRVPRRTKLRIPFLARIAKTYEMDCLVTVPFDDELGADYESDCSV